MKVRFEAGQVHIVPDEVHRVRVCFEKPYVRMHDNGELNVWVSIDQVPHVPHREPRCEDRYVCWAMLLDNLHDVHVVTHRMR